MNEVIFLIHIICILIFTLGFLRLGKEALTAGVVLLAILANLFVLKQTHLFGLDVTCSDVLMIGSLASLNLLQNFFGRESAKKAVMISFFALAFFVLVAEIHLYYRPSQVDIYHPAYEAILSPSPRLLFASLFTFAFVQLVDLKIFQKLPFSFPLRNATSLILSQLLDTVLFSLLGLYGLVNSLGSIILMSYLVKLAIILLLSPFLAVAKKIVRTPP